jgi:hypothetical protein
MLVKSSLIQLSLLILCFLIYAPSNSEASEKAYFAGVAVLADFQQLDSSFPNVSALFKELNGDGVPAVDAAVGRAVAQSGFGDKLVMGELGNYKKGDGVTLALAVDWENVTKEAINDSVKLVVDVHAQILIFDFEEMKIIGTFPIAVQVRDVVPAGEEAKRVSGIVRDVFLTPGSANIVDQFLKRLADIEIKASYGNRIRVTEVKVSGSAADVASSSGKPARDFEAFVAQSFGKFLSANEAVPILPYSKGTAIGGKMAARFVNGDVYQLAVPEPDYDVSLEISQLKKIKAAENAGQVAWLFGNYSNVRVEQKELGKIYMDAGFKYGVIKKLPARLKGDDWSAYQESLLSFFDNLTRQIGARDSSWIKKWGLTEDIAEKLQAFSSVLEKCR